MKRLLCGWFVILLGAGLVACGPAKESVYPPTLSIQQLTVLSNGQWRVTLRIQNNSYGEMDFKSLEGQLQIGVLTPIRLHKTFERDIPELAGDVVLLDVLPTNPMLQALQAVAGKGSAGSVTYHIKGAIHAKPEQEKHARDFDFEGNGWISPVPGIPNTWR
ncbi:MAG: hypothetical protein EPN69_11365 [Rhodanobacter sp.]|nr:MAG: hypothetical protein EPN69_11365 [Rhodanobacter sp.]TAM05932.1 MAG: hypothetical protein EPN71_01475 [Rhodanobacter sp.]TAM39330.1 MAG: hypothetical protein EPN58_14230 [Rhodanobacter sp.]TAN23331.1 MAG: hypothetical protein EPN32_11650 [Rhodanobacter sp.]